MSTQIHDESNAILDSIIDVITVTQCAIKIKYEDSLIKIKTLTDEIKHEEDSLLAKKKIVDDLVSKSDHIKTFIIKSAEFIAKSIQVDVFDTYADHQSQSFRIKVCGYDTVEEVKRMVLKERSYDSISFKNETTEQQIDTIKTMTFSEIWFSNPSVRIVVSLNFRNHC